jgi:hypothetical protein
MLTLKIGTVKVYGTIWADRSDLSWKLVRPVKIIFSNYPLDITIWTPDEEVMPPGRPAP